MIETNQKDRLSRHRKITRISRAMKWFLTLCLFFLLLLGALMISSLFGLDVIELGTEMVEYGEVERRYADLPALQQIGLLSSGLVRLAALIALLWCMRRLFSAFQRLDFFSATALSNMLWTGIWFLIFAVLDFTEEPIDSILSTIDLAEGQRSVSIEFEGGEIFFLIFGAFFVTLAWVLREAALVQEENDQFI